MHSAYTTPVSYTPWKVSTEDILNDEIVSSGKAILRTYFTSQSQEPKFLTSISQKQAFSALTL